MVRDVAISMTNLLCSSMTEPSHRGRGHDAAPQEASAKGATKGSRGGSAAETGRQAKGALEGDDWGGRGGEKGKGGWGRGRGKGGWKGGRTQKKKSMMDGVNDDMSPDFVPYKKKNVAKTYNKVNEATSVYTQPDQKLRGTDPRVRVRVRVRGHTGSVAH